MYSDRFAQMSSEAQWTGFGRGVRGHMPAYRCFAILLFALAACSQPAAVLIEPLRVLNWSPSPGAICVRTDIAIHATFSASLDESSLSAESFFVQDAGGPLAATIDYDATAQTATLTLQAPLDYEQLYTAVVVGVRSEEQGVLPVRLESSFQTVARSGCAPAVECQRDSDCTAPEICANIGVCVPQCVTDRDCYIGTCSSGTCIESDSNPPGGDPAVGD